MATHTTIIKTFNAIGTVFKCPEADLEVKCFTDISSPFGKITLCAKGEVSVELDAEDLRCIKRSKQQWELFLNSRGMLNPTASVVSSWLYDQQEVGYATQTNLIDTTTN